MMKFNYHEDGSIPVADRTVWVFGSNLSGYHGAGAAQVAHLTFNARWGEGSGWVSLFSYAIPTKDTNVYNTLPLEEIKASIELFVRETYNNPTLKFFVTRVGCGYAGYEDSVIAPLFAGCNPDNCSFAGGWAQYLEPKLKPVIEKKGADHPDVLAYIRGQHRGLYTDLEDQIRSCVRTNRERTNYILNDELPRVKKAIKSTVSTLELLREFSGLRDADSEDQTRLISTIQTLNKVRHSQREELTWLAGHQRYNKNALNTLMRERERCLPSCGSGVPEPTQSENVQTDYQVFAFDQFGRLLRVQP